MVDNGTYTINYELNGTVQTPLQVMISGGFGSVFIPSILPDGNQTIPTNIQVHFQGTGFYQSSATNETNSANIINFISNFGNSNNTIRNNLKEYLIEKFVTESGMFTYNQTDDTYTMVNNQSLTWEVNYTFYNYYSGLIPYQGKKGYSVNSTVQYSTNELNMLNFSSDEITVYQYFISNISNAGGYGKIQNITEWTLSKEDFAILWINILLTTWNSTDNPPTPSNFHAFDVLLDNFTNYINYIKQTLNSNPSAQMSLSSFYGSIDNGGMGGGPGFVDPELIGLAAYGSIGIGLGAVLFIIGTQTVVKNDPNPETFTGDPSGVGSNSGSGSITVDQVTYTPGETTPPKAFVFTSVFNAGSVSNFIGTLPMLLKTLLDMTLNDILLSKLNDIIRNAEIIDPSVSSDVSTSLFSYYLSLFDNTINDNEKDINGVLLKLIASKRLSDELIKKMIELWKHVYKNKEVENWKVSQLGTDIVPVDSYYLPNPGYSQSSLSVDLLEILKIAPMIGLDIFNLKNYVTGEWGEILTSIYLDTRGYAPFIGWDNSLNVAKGYSRIIGPRPDFFLMTKFMWVESKSKIGNVEDSAINYELKEAHTKIYNHNFFNTPIGGITCWVPDKNTLYVAWIEVFAFDPNLPGA